MSAPLEIVVSIESDGWPQDIEALAEQAIRAAFEHGRVPARGVAEVSLLLTGDSHQQELNRTWRGIDKPTNVLSFPQLPPFAPLAGLVGDISLARETVAREAEEQGKSFTDHFVHLCVHGFLHLLGYDHATDEEALVMEGLETQILAGLEIADPYRQDETPGLPFQSAQR